MAIDSHQFRTVCGRFATGVTVVTAVVDGEPYGMTANAFCSVSLDPPLVLVCIDRRAAFHDRVARAGAFAVNLLAARQREISDRFAGRRPDLADRFSGLAWRPGATGAPVLDGGLGHLDCRLWAAYDGGDHTIYVGQVVDAAVVGGADADDPLLFFASRYRSIGGPL